jgi:hypothetical protein
MYPEYQMYLVAHYLREYQMYLEHLATHSILVYHSTH